MTTVTRRRPAGIATHEVLTPEGVVLSFQIAHAGERIGAFLVDLMIQTAAAALVFMLVSPAAFFGEAWVGALALLLFFLLRNFYFIWFELRWQGATPGKRTAGLRVVDAQGGPLTADAVFVRNVMRELEFWLPLSLLLAQEYVWPDAPAGARLFSTLWAMVFLLLPLFNRHRLRVGDLVAGTRVVVAPKSVLLTDLGGEEMRRQEEATPRYRFTERQLAVYGIYELQVLEDLLRQLPSRSRKEALEAVSARIRRKIGWEGGDVEHERFLREFYAALRERLERRMLLGKRKLNKFTPD